MNLDEFFDYKNKLMDTICSNKQIISLVTDDAEANVPNLDLKYNLVYPYEYIPDVVDEAKTFICFDVDIASVENKTFYLPVLYVWAFTHKTKMKLEHGGVRIDLLSVEINKELNGSRYFGLGELDLYSVGRFAPGKDYQGRVLTYYAKDFNRGGQSKKPPANRKVY